MAKPQTQPREQKATATAPAPTPVSVTEPLLATEKLVKEYRHRRVVNGGIDHGCAG